MIKRIVHEEALCFDDVLLMPQESGVTSRHAVNLSMIIGAGKRAISLDLPVIASPMDTVCGKDMCIAMSNLGGIGILHRYLPIEEQVEIVSSLSDGGYKFGVSVGATNNFMNDARKLVKAGAKLILVDIANGHSHYAVEAVKSLREEFDIHIMAGNVATAAGFKLLAEAGADSIRVGIGGGSACTTRIVSGHGVPTLASIMDVDLWRDEYPNTSIIADGGIRNSGDMVKAFAAGATAVMLGSMLAGTEESPGEVTQDHSGKDVKIFRGMASAHAQMDKFGKVSVAEGISTTVPYKGSVSHIIEQVRGGLGSGCSYSGVNNLSELAKNAVYVRVSSASLSESKPHAL